MRRHKMLVKMRKYRRKKWLYRKFTLLLTRKKKDILIIKQGKVFPFCEERGVNRVLVGKPEGRRPLGRPRRRWADNIRMDLQEVGCGYMDWIGLAQDRDSWRTFVSAVMSLRVPWKAGNFLTSCKQHSFSRRTLHHAVSRIKMLQSTNVQIVSFYFY